MSDNGPNGPGESLFDVDPFTTTRGHHIAISRAKDVVTDVREFAGGWTLSKLRVFELYLNRYRVVAGNGSYIDGFAGSGSLRVKGRAEDFMGSARIAMESTAFKDVWLFEKDKAIAELLDRTMRYHYPWRRRRRLRIVADDFNTAIVSVLAERQITTDRPCFAFLDPDSTQLDWETVALLAGYKEPVAPPTRCKVELWILFNSHQALGRLVDRQGDADYADSPRACALDRVMGGREAWWDLCEQRAHINVFARRYAERLQSELGYGFAHAQLITDPDSTRPQYFMIHASDHPAAWDLMRWAKQQSNAFDNTIELPGMAPTRKVSRRIRRR
ncbi:MAG: three-Cys-motif partner protein TcmP [Acidimicrobiales bacterium]